MGPTTCSTAISENQMSLMVTMSMPLITIQFRWQGSACGGGCLRIEIFGIACNCTAKLGVGIIWLNIAVPNLYPRGETWSLNEMAWVPRRWRRRLVSFLDVDSGRLLKPRADTRPPRVVSAYRSPIIRERDALTILPGWGRGRCDGAPHEKSRDAVIPGAPQYGTCVLAVEMQEAAGPDISQSSLLQRQVHPGLALCSAALSMISHIFLSYFSPG